jgi:hypothetical protein
MKTKNTNYLFLLLAGMGLVGQQKVHADSFEIIRDGQSYLCEEREPSDPGSVIRCAETAYRGPYSRDQSTQLCQGARSEAPAICGIAAYRGPFSIEQSISLCIKASNNGPVECGVAAYRGPFNIEQSVRLCAQRGTTAHSDCAIQAYRGPYTADEAVELCRTTPLLVLETLKIINANPAMLMQSKKIRFLKQQMLNKK